MHLYQNRGKKVTIVGKYVDDILTTGKDEAEIRKISKTIGDKFRMKELGEVKQFLGIEV